MPKCVNALVKPVQYAARNPALDRIAPNPGPIQLPSPDHPMLRFGDLPNRVIDPRRGDLSHSVCPLTRRAFPVSTPGNAPLVDHATDAVDLPCTRGAHRVASPPNLPLKPATQKRPQPAVAASGFDPFK